MRAAISRPLFSMLVWLSIAAFGNDVVPDVNWILIVSAAESGESGVTEREAEARRIVS